jgi:hypothetical protein
VASGLVLPWLAVPLEADRGPFSLPVALGGLPSDPRLSYGVALAACLSLALLATVRSGGRPSAVTAALGLVLLGLCLAFVFATGTSDWPLLQHLRDQAAERDVIFQQLGYAVPATEPRLMLGAPLTGDWSQLAGGLRAGWFGTGGGGLVLLLSGLPRLPFRLGAAGWRGLVPAAAALLAVGGLIGLAGRGGAAAYLADRGIQAARAGDYRAARSSLATAHALDPSMARGVPYELALGQALLASGQSSDPLALLAEAESRDQTGDVGRQVAELREAVKRDPGDPVLVQELRQASRQLALVRGDARPLQALGHPTAADRYTEGRVLYDRASYAEALACFRTVTTLTREPNVVSSAYTYISLSEMKLGASGDARHDLVRAVAVDTGYNNTLARSLATGLYVAGE